MFANSTKTLDDFKTDFIAQVKDNNILDRDIIFAYNRFTSLVGRQQRTHAPHTNRATTSSISVTSSGYDLSGISDLGTTEMGFKVYKDAVKAGNTLPRTYPASRRAGYYIEGSTLYITPDKDSATIFIEYQTTTTRVASGTTLSSVTFGFDQDLEEAFHMYLRYSYHDGEFEIQAGSNAEQLALSEIDLYFGVNKSANAMKI